VFAHNISHVLASKVESDGAPVGRVEIFGLDKTAFPQLNIPYAGHTVRMHVCLLVWCVCVCVCACVVFPLILCLRYTHAAAQGFVDALQEEVLLEEQANKDGSTCFRVVPQITASRVRMPLTLTERLCVLMISLFCRKQPSLWSRSRTLR
jgi:hypothetical protein